MSEQGKSPGRVRHFLKREPLVHFFVLAALLFVANSLVSGDSREVITVDVATREYVIKQRQNLILRDLSEQEKAGWAFCPPGGEDRKTVQKRSQKALLEAAAQWPGSNILVVTHEGVIKSLIYHLCDRKFLATEPAILKPYQVHRLAHDQNGLRVEELNALSIEAGC